MPFLRVLRDKRGYETTYLVHWIREGNRQRSRILYVFRTPPGIRVGRDPFDPEIVREIESRHPDIQFDWRALRENQQVVDALPDARRARVAARERRRKEEPAPAPVPAEKPVAEPRPAIPAAIEGDTRAAQLAFLSKWYADLRERVPHRTHDPVRLDALLGLVERLNPAAWTTEQDIEQGLQHASEALGRLSRVLSKRRRRARRAKPAPASGPQPSEPADLDAAVPEPPAEDFEVAAPIESSEPIERPGEEDEPQVSATEWLGPTDDERASNDPNDQNGPNDPNDQNGPNAPNAPNAPNDPSDPNDPNDPFR